MTNSNDSNLHDAISAARACYTDANPASHAAFEAATRSMPGGNTRTTVFYPPFPLTMAGGSRATLTDIDGHEYVDFLGEYSAGIYGHDHPVIRDAINSALSQGWNLGACGTLEGQLADVLCARFPSLDLVRFTNSGTEANLIAVATAGR